MKNRKTLVRLSPAEEQAVRSIVRRYSSCIDVLRDIPNTVIERTGERLRRQVERATTACAVSLVVSASSLCLRPAVTCASCGAGQHRLGGLMSRSAK